MVHIFPLQVRELSNEAMCLSTSYLGDNAAVITSSMEKAQLAWESVQSAANTRKKKLRAASELKKFLSLVRERGREGGNVCICSGHVQNVLVVRLF